MTSDRGMKFTEGHTHPATTAGPGNASRACPRPSNRSRLRRSQQEWRGGEAAAPEKRKPRGHPERLSDGHGPEAVPTVRSP